MEALITNGVRIELGEIVDPSTLTEEDYGLPFETAMMLARDGIAVARELDCARVVFLRDGVLYVGALEEDGQCSGDEEYVASAEDQAARDWLLMGVDVTPSGR